MGRMAEKYTDLQRAAIAAAIIDRGLSGPAASRAAAAGQLVNPDDPAETLEPFEMPEGSARSYANRERARRAGKALDEPVAGQPLERLDLLVDRCLRILEHGLHQVERKAEKRKYELTTADVERTRKIASAAREVRALHIGAPTQLGGKGKTKAQREGDEAEKAKRAAMEETGGSDLASQLVADHKANATGHREPEPGDPQRGKNTRDGEKGSSPARDSTPTQREGEAAGSGVLA